MTICAFIRSKLLEQIQSTVPIDVQFVQLDTRSALLYYLRGQAGPTKFPRKPISRILDSWKFEHARGIEFRLHRRNRVTSADRSWQRGHAVTRINYRCRFQGIHRFLGQRLCGRYSRAKCILFPLAFISFCFNVFMLF